jgi:hypothetical protein
MIAMQSAGPAAAEAARADPTAGAVNNMAALVRALFT